ncbi:hypothetical protein SRHO_G00021760 [Serrasalmus rhombeus]
MANISSIPGVDHTTGSPWGQVMQVDGEDPAMFSKAILERTFIQSTALGCQISFWYHLHDPIGLSSHFALSMVTNGSSLVLWEIKKGQTDGWVNASVRLGNRPEGFKTPQCLVPITTTVKKSEALQSTMSHQTTKPQCKLNDFAYISL